VNSLLFSDFKLKMPSEKSNNLMLEKIVDKMLPWLSEKMYIIDANLWYDL